MTARLILLAVIATAWLAWPTGTQKSEPERWIVKSTENYKGHPVWHGPNLVECTNAAVDDLGPTVLVRYPQWRQLQRGDTCPAGDIVWKSIEEPAP